MHCIAQDAHVECPYATKSIKGKAPWFFPLGGSNQPSEHCPTTSEPTHVGATPKGGAKWSSGGPNMFGTGAWQ